MPAPVVIAVDAMGGDHAPRTAVEGALRALQVSDCSLILVGDEEKIRKHARGADPSRFEVIHTDEVVGMDEPAITPIRRKRRSSMRLAAEQVREGRAQAMFTAGNTGAGMICAKMVIGTLEGVERPALAQVFPNLRGGSTLLLDVGANVDAKPEFLRQFAVMGHIFSRNVLGCAEPRIGLMSIGEEEGKGTDFTRNVFHMMKGESFNFIGNVEGRDVFRGTVDVIICDGFVGNVILKSAESLADLISSFVRQEMNRNWRTRLGALLARSGFQSLRRRLDYSEYGGAPLLGVKGGCFIGHGRSNAKAVMNAVLKAAEFSAAEVPAKMEAEIASLLRYEAELRHEQETAE